MRHQVDVINKFLASLDRKLKESGGQIDKCTSLFRTYTMASILNIGFNAPNEIDFDRERNEFIDVLDLRSCGI